MSDSLLNEGSSQTQPSQASAAAPVAEKAAPQATQAQNQPVANQAQVGQPNSDNASKPQGNVAEFQISTPEGQKFDSHVLNKYTEVAKELNLPQEAAQKMLDKIAPVMQERQQQQLSEIRETWANNSRADKEFGGEKLQENLAVARKALDTFGTQELRVLLNESGLENHPEVIRLLYKAGRAISSDRYVGGATTGGKSAAPRSFNEAAAFLYPNQN